MGSIFIHVRGLPMFATLMGYGIGMILALLSRFKDKTLLIIAGVLSLLTVFAGVAMSILVRFGQARSLAEITNQMPVPSSYIDQLSNIGHVLAFQLGMAVPGGGLVLFPVMILGMVAARHNVLGQPEKYLPQLRWATIVAVVIAVGIGIPCGLAVLGVLSDKDAMTFFIANQVLGPLTGPGIVASIALISIPLKKRIDAADTAPAAIQAVVALGKRSMTGYLLQSILFTVFTATYTLGLGRNQGAWEASLVGAGIWLITVLIAYAMDKANMRGPFEVLHRRLSYGKNGLATPTQ